MKILGIVYDETVLEKLLDDAESDNYDDEFRARNTRKYPIMLVTDSGDRRGFVEFVIKNVLVVRHEHTVTFSIPGANNIVFDADDIRERIDFYTGRFN